MFYFDRLEYLFNVLDLPIFMLYVVNNYSIYCNLYANQKQRSFMNRFSPQENRL